MDLTPSSKQRASAQAHSAEDRTTGPGELYKGLVTDMPISSNSLQATATEKPVSDEKGRLRKFFNSAKRQGLDVAPEPKGKPIFLFFAAKGRNKAVKVFFDKGCSDCIVREGIPGVEWKGIITKKGPFGMGGVGGISSMTKDEWMVLVPRADGKMQAVRCYSMNQVTCVFPTFQLTEAVEAVKADAPENSLLQNCKLPDSIGGEVDCLMGIKYNHLHGEIIHTIPETGLSIYKCNLMSHDGSVNAMVGGPHESFEILANVVGGAPALLAHFTKRLEELRSGAVPCIRSNPVCLEEIEFAKKANLLMGEFADTVNLTEMVGDDDTFEEFVYNDSQETVVLCSCCKEEITVDMRHTLVNSDERITNVKKWRETMDAGLNVDYRCVRCRNCSDCRNSEETEKVSLRQEAEDHMIKESVHVDYKKRIITATLPLRGREEEFLAPNRGSALCVLDQQCRRFSNRSEDRALIKTAFNKLFEKGYLVLLKDLSPSIRAKFENKPAQYWIPWRIVHNPRSLSTPVRPVMDASSRTKTRPDGTAGRCLNDLVVKGRIDTLNLLRMILRFSIGRYAVSGDLSKFYNCFRLREDYWNLQRFLFRENLNIDDPVLEGIIVTLMYGVKCVSAQTECAMVRIANHVKNQHPGLAEALIKSRYVDDIADSKATLIEIDDITKSGDEVFEQVGLSCKGWTTTGADPSVDVAGGENYVGVAGQNWPRNKQLFALKWQILAPTICDW